jgi:hypothetical protein
MKKRFKTPQSLPELAASLGFSVTSVRHWARRPDAPQGYEVAAWRAYILENGLGVVGNRVSGEREALLIAIGKENLATARARRRKEEGSAVDAAVVDAFLGDMAMRARLKLYDAMMNQLPGKVVGRLPAEVREVGRKIADSLCEEFENAEERFRADHPAQVERVDSMAKAAVAPLVHDDELAAQIVQTLRAAELLALYEPKNDIQITNTAQSED